MLVPPCVQWADPSISLEAAVEVQARFHPFPRDGPVACRRWRPVVDRDSRCIDLSTDRSKVLVLGRRYVVLAYTEAQLGIAPRVHAAAVLRFEGFVKHPDEARHAHLQYLRSRLEDDVKALYEAIADERIVQFGVEDDFDDEMGPPEWRFLQEVHKWRMACTVLRFSQLGGRRRTFDIDLYGPATRCGGLELLLEALPLTSHKWACKQRDYGEPATVSSSLEATAAMERIRRAHSLLMIRQVAALRIQRRWRHALADPAHPVCRRRLQAEFNQLAEGGKELKRKQPEKAADPAYTEYVRRLQAEFREMAKGGKGGTRKQVIEDDEETETETETDTEEEEEA